MLSSRLEPAAQQGKSCHWQLLAVDDFMSPPQLVKRHMHVLQGPVRREVSAGIPEPSFFKNLEADHTPTQAELT